jgi:hypothetical protein
VDLDETITIAAPEGIELRLQLAGLGSRFIAGAADLIIQLGLLGILAVITGPVAGLSGVVDVIGGFVIVLFYPMLFEVLGVGPHAGQAHESSAGPARLGRTRRPPGERDSKPDAPDRRPASHVSADGRVDRRHEAGSAPRRPRGREIVTREKSSARRASSATPSVPSGRGSRAPPSAGIPARSPLRRWPRSGAFSSVARASSGERANSWRFASPTAFVPR